jgi:hypothetical protein
VSADSALRGYSIVLRERGQEIGRMPLGTPLFLGGYLALHHPTRGQLHYHVDDITTYGHPTYSAPEGGHVFVSDEVWVDLTAVGQD